jgi:hypothetical protein
VACPITTHTDRPRGTLIHPRRLAVRHMVSHRMEVMPTVVATQANRRRMEDSLHQASIRRRLGKGGTDSHTRAAKADIHRMVANPAMAVVSQEDTAEDTEHRRAIPCDEISCVGSH